MYIKEYRHEYFCELSGLIKDHGTIARRSLDDFQFDRLESGLDSDHIKTLCCFNGNELVSFMISSMLANHPAWIIRLICSKKTNFFMPEQVGLCDLYNETILHWENIGITNFLYIQPSLFVSTCNVKIRKGSYKLRQYAPFDYCGIPANTESIYPFIREAVGNRIFPEDMIVRWCFKNEK